MYKKNKLYYYIISGIGGEQNINDGWTTINKYWRTYIEVLLWIYLLCQGSVPVVEKFIFVFAKRDRDRFTGFKEGYPRTRWQISVDHIWRLPTR